MTVSRDTPATKAEELDAKKTEDEIAATFRGDRERDGTPPLTLDERARTIFAIGEFVAIAGQNFGDLDDAALLARLYVVARNFRLASARSKDQDIVGWEKRMRDKWLSFDTIREHAGEIPASDMHSIQAVAGFVISEAADALVALASRRDEVERERDEARREWGACEERLGNEIDANKAAWAKHGATEIALGQTRARATTAESQRDLLTRQLTEAREANNLISWLPNGRASYTKGDDGFWDVAIFPEHSPVPVATVGYQMDKNVAAFLAIKINEARALSSDEISTPAVGEEG